MNKIIIVEPEELEAIVKKHIDKGFLDLYEKLSNRKARPTYTRAEAAVQFGVSKATVTNMIERGTIKTTADGKYIPLSEIERYLNK